MMSHVYEGRRVTALLLCVVMMISACSAALAAAFSDSPDDIEKRALSVLMLTIYDNKNRAIATGSGFVMFDDRTLITNYHVVEDGYAVMAESDTGTTYVLDRILISSKDKDLAILRFEKNTGMQPLPYSTGKVRRGERVVSIGSPEGLKNTVSMGNVSSVYEMDGVSMIQITAPISHGSSGGALFNDTGEVIGVTSASYVEGQNLNLAISMQEVVDLYALWDGTLFAISDYEKSQPGRHTSTPAAVPPAGETQQPSLPQQQYAEGYPYTAVITREVTAYGSGSIVLKEGTTVIVLSEDRMFASIVYDGSNYTVNKNCLKPYDEPAVPEVTQAPAQPAAGSDGYPRTGVTDRDIAAYGTAAVTIPKGAEVIILSEDSMFARILWQGETYVVNRNYVTAVEGDTPSADISGTTEEDCTVDACMYHAVATEDANIFGGATGVIPKGTRVHVISDADRTYTRISYEGKECLVKQSVLERVK